MEDLDFTDGKLDPPKMKVNMNRLTGAEQAFIEKHIGCSMVKVQSGEVGSGDFSTAVAAVMLKRLALSRGEDFTDAGLLKQAELYAVEVAQDEVPPTNQGDSTPKSPSPATSPSPLLKSEG